MLIQLLSVMFCNAACCAAWLIYQDKVYTKLGPYGKAVRNACVAAATEGVQLPGVNLEQGSVWHKRKHRESFRATTEWSVQVGSRWKPLFEL
jgi:hypothetical protein